MSSNPPLRTGDLLTIMGDIKPIDCSAHWAAVAAGDVPLDVEKREAGVAD